MGDFTDRLRGRAKGMIVLAAVPALVFGTMLTASAASAQTSVAAAHASAAPEPTPHGTAPRASVASAPCNEPTFVCFWVGSNWSGDMGKFAGSNEFWGDYPEHECVYPAAAHDADKTWNDCASSIYNDGTSGLGVDVYQNSKYGGAVSCIPDKSTIYSDLADWQYGSNTSVNMNDSISSNNWGPCD
jgi:Peptidase inhibitor family I36